MASTSEDDEWEVCNYEGFIAKRRKRNNTTLEVSTRVVDHEAVARRWKIEKKKEILLRLKDRYKREIDEWESVCEELRRMEDKVREAPPSTSGVELNSIVVNVDSQSQSQSVANNGCCKIVEEILFQAEAQEAILKDLSSLCDISEAMCRDREESLNESFFNLPIWVHPDSIISSLTYDEEC